MTTTHRQSPEGRSPTEKRIFDVAAELFYEKGFHAATMREVASRVGMKAGSLYNHYPSKQELLHRIALDTMHELLEGGLDAVEGCEKPGEKLRALMEWHVTYHAERRFQAKVADDELHSLEPRNRAHVIAARDEYEQVLKGILAEGRERAGWDVPDLSVVAFGIATMCTAVAGWFREDGRLSIAEVATIYADFVLAALARRADEAP